MNQQPERPSDALRSDIDTTRDRMDQTIDALGNRLEGRHLVDEVIGFFRGRNRDDGTPSQLGERLSHSAETAVHSVVDTVKAHPIPAIMIGAGVGWLIYELRSGGRHRGNGRAAEPDYSRYTGEAYLAEHDLNDPDETDGEGLRDKVTGAASHAKEKLGTIGDKARETVSHLGELGREKFGAAKEQLSHLSGDVQHRGQEVYDRTRERVVSTVDQHPLSVGLGCLALGLVIGLVTPTPRVVNRRLGPTVDRLRDRTRKTGSELLEKGKRVVQAAASAAKVEAKTQGLTVARVREEATAVANRAREAASETARQEGLAPAAAASSQSSFDPTQGGAGRTDPSNARPAV